MVVPKPQLMHQVDDGILQGNIERKRGECGVCGHTTMVIRVHTPTLENLADLDIDPTRTLLKGITSSSRLRADPHIGIGCGCYAKFHRQIAHIRDRKKRRRVERGRYPTTAS